MKRLQWLGPPTVAFLIWSLLTYGIGVSNALVPRPFAVFARIALLLTEPGFWNDTLVTLRACVLGLVIGFGAGYLLGVVSGVIRWIDSTLSPSLHFLRSIPSVAYYPIIIIYLGFGEVGRVVLIAVPVSLLTFASCVAATLSVNRHRKEYLQGLQPSRWQMFKLLLVWETLPAAVNALRLSASLALVLVVFAELTIGGMDGLGARLRDARQMAALEEAYGIVIILGVIGWIANRLVSAIELKLQVAWGR